LPIIEAFKKVCQDRMGKKALRGALKKIIVQNTKASFSSSWATFEGGVLTLDYQFANVNEVSARADVLGQVVEKAL
jgi:hypothetical protein